jgi:hypothetical protein
MSHNALVRELAGRTGLTQTQITKVLTELHCLTNEKVPSSRVAKGGKVHQVTGYQGIKLRFTKKAALASVRRKPSFADLIAEIKRNGD